MNLEKRIKRHIWSQKHSYSIDVPKDLVPVCRGELSDLNIESVIDSSGSIRFLGKLEEAYSAHLYLRTVARIWLTLPEFSAGAREELFRKASTLPWELYLSPGAPLRVQPTVRKSRIQHEGNAVETLTEAIARRFTDLSMEAPEASPAETDFVQRIKLEICNNRVEIQIDLSGEHLHRRGYRILTGEAPIRENLAAGIILWSIEQWQKRSANDDYPQRIHDPFCGSGTIPAEAGLISTGRAPGGRREFQFMHQPHYREASFQYLLRQVELKETAPLFTVSGSDINRDAVEISVKNCRRANTNPEITCEDAFSPHGFPESGKEVLIVTNPPYGERLRGGNSLYRKLISKMKETGTSGTFIIPGKLYPGLSLPADTLKLRLNNGGIPVYAVFYSPFE